MCLASIFKKIYFWDFGRVFFCLCHIKISHDAPGGAAEPQAGAFGILNLVEFYLFFHKVRQRELWVMATEGLTHDIIADVALL